MTTPANEDIPEIVTDVPADVDELVYQVPVLVEIRLQADPEDPEGEAQFDEAYEIVSTTLQRAWETDEGRGFGIRVHPWSFEISQGDVKVVDLDVADSV